MFKPKNFTEKIVHRLQIAQGHLKKVQRMVESDSYCIDIIHQSMAVQKALKEIDSLILENHLNTCVADAIAKGKKKEVLDEIMEILKKKT